MSEHITHIAIFEDSARLVAYAESFHQAFKASLQDYPDAGLMASGSRGNHLFAIPIIESVRDNWQENWAGAGPKLAAALGWLSHRAIDLVVKPRDMDSQEIHQVRYSSSEHQIYHDAVVFDQVYQRGRAPSRSPYVYFSEATLAPEMQGHPGADLLHVSRLEPLVCALIQQQLLEMRQFNRDASDPEAWLDAFPQHYQDLSENLETYIEAFTDPDPLKMSTYIQDRKVYEPTDPLIQLVRDLQASGRTDIDLEQALELATEQSQYAMGLAQSFRFLQAAQAFFEKRIDKATVYDRVKIFNESHRL